MAKLTIENGMEIFNVSKESALKFIKEFEELKENYDAKTTMKILFYSALDDEDVYNVFLMNAWKTLVEATEFLNTKGETIH